MEYISYEENKLKELDRIKNNNKYIKMELENHKQYFDNMFKTIDNNIKLDIDQRKIILNEEKYLMVIAGAGSGKTTTISAKVNYLIDKKNIKDDEIIVISFTNKAVEELKKRINEDFKHQVNVTTFHKFSYHIIKENTKYPPKIETNPEIIIKKYIENNLIKNIKKLKQFINLYIYYFDIKEEIMLFNDYNKYIKYKNRQKYPTLKSKLEYIKDSTNSINETKIANYLYLHDIEYEYQKQYEYDNSYKPDFTIKIDGKTYYIEYFNIKKIHKFKHIKNINIIRNIHKKNKTNLIEIYNDDILETLNNNIKITEDDIIKIFDKIIQNNDQAYKKFITFCNTYINLFKSKNYKEIKLDEFKNNDKRKTIFIDFIKGLYKFYNQELQNQNKIDYNDMINLANHIIITKNIHLKYKYIIIDEYQDISECRYQLISNITKLYNNKLMIVGDDWQSIYGFASSNISLFTGFKNNVQYCETMKIVKTYRNSQQLIDIAGKFILKNNKQITKKLISNKKLKNPVIILKYKKIISPKIIEAIEYLINKYGENKNILILGRYNFDINKINNKNIKTEKNKIIYKKYPNVNIEYMTIHASKGLGYDNVILINATSGILGFPSEIKTDYILEDLIKEEEKIKYPEERRLFYVALTRTKNEIIILTPCDNSSIFIKEIKKYKNVIEKSNIYKNNK